MIDDGLYEELSALLDGALPEPRAKELRRRIAAEPELRREYEEMERAVKAVRALPRARAPAELRARIRGSLGEGRSRGRVFRLAALAAAAVVLLAVALMLQLGRDRAPRHQEAGEPSLRRFQDGDRVPAKEKAFGEAPAAEPVEEKEETALGSRARDDGVGAESQLGAAVPKDGVKRGTARAKLEEDLLLVVEKAGEIPAEGRKAYLRQVAALGADKALEHVRAVIPDDGREEREGRFEKRDGKPPVLATIQVEDREEANLLRGILDAAPRPEAGATAAMTVEDEAKDQISTEVLGTPADLRRLAQWLLLFDLARPAASRPKVAVLDETKAANAPPPKVRAAVVRLRFGKPPEPQPTGPGTGK